MNPLFDSAKLIGLALSAGVLAITHYSAYRLGSQGVQAEFDAYRLEQLEATRKLQEASRGYVDELKTDAEKRIEVKNAELAKINNRLDATLSELRKRAGRGSEANMPNTASAQSICTGRGLFSEDAEFLAREAARADSVKYDLVQCQGQYNKSKELLEHL
jgi:hypothetical protein